MCLNVIIIILVILSGRRRRKNKRVKEEENNEIDLAHADFEDSELVSDLNESKHIWFVQGNHNRDKRSCTTDRFT